MTQDILGCDDSVGKQDDFKNRAEQASEKWLRDNDWDYQKYGDRRQDRSAYASLMNYEISGILAQAFEEGALWARSNLDSEGLVTMSQANWEKVQADLKRYRDALSAIEELSASAGSQTVLVWVIDYARKALRESGEK